MGNTQAFYYRLPALFAASFASCAVGLLAISGAICDFVEVKANGGKLLYFPDVTETPTETNTYLGIICINPLYEDVVADDLMFMLSRVCFFVALAMGSFTCVLSWSLSSFITPTEANWKLLSVFAAVSAVLQMPVFLVFETDPCTAFQSEQECYIASGSLYLILSTAFWVVVTLATQFLDPPRWADELNAWRTKGSVASQAHSRPAEGESQAPLLVAPNKTGLISGFQRWTQRRRWVASAELPKNQTDPVSVAVEEEEIEQNQLVEYIARNDSGLVLNVLPTGKLVGDDTKSVPSFEDLDSIVRLAEEGKLPDSSHSNSLAPPSRNGSFSNSLAPPSRDGSFARDDTEKACDDPKNLQMVVWDNLRDEEAAEKQLVNEIYNELEDAEPVIERQLVVASAPPVSQWALPPNEEQHDGPPNEPKPSTEKSTIKAPSVIKNLTDNLKRRSRARRSRNNKYALMDDDSSESSHPVFPTEVFVLPEVSGAPTKQAEFPCYDEGALKGLRQSRSYDNEAYPDPIIAMGSESFGSSDDEPDPIISSTWLSSEIDESSIDGTEDRDSDSDASDDSHSSDSYEGQRLVSSRDRRSSRRCHGGRGYSSVRSVVSSASLLDTIIAEETDADLQEHEDTVPYDLVRSKSAPTQLPAGATNDQYCQQNFHLDYDHASVSTLGSIMFQEDHGKIQLAPITSVRRSRSVDVARSEVSSYPSGMGTSDPDTTFGSEFEDPVECISFSSSVHRPVHRKDPPVQESNLSSPGDEDDNDAPDPPGLAADYSQSTTDSFEAEIQQWDQERLGKINTAADYSQSTSDSFEAEIQLWGQKRLCKINANNNLPPNSKCLSPASPALTAPETPSPVPSTRSQPSSQQDLSVSYESERSWKEERRWGGIHAAPLDDSDDSSNEDADVSIRVREARIRRLQREKEAIKQRGRAQSHDPISRRRPSPSAMSSIVDKLDLQLIEVLRPDGVEYGPDEQSL